MWNRKKNYTGLPILLFFFENETNLKSFFISEGNIIKFHNLNYVNVEPNFIEIRYVGKIKKNEFILIHTRARREYVCSFLSTEEQIYKELENFYEWFFKSNFGIYFCLLKTLDI